MVLVAVAGVGGLTALGGGLGDAIAVAGGPGGVAAPASRAGTVPMATSGQAALGPAAHAYEAGLRFASHLAAEADQGARALDAAKDATELAARSRDLKGVERGLNAVVEANHFEDGRRLLRLHGGLPDLHSYENLLSRRFIPILRELRGDQHWIDMGSGSGAAISDYFASLRSGRSGFLGLFGDKIERPRVTAVAKKPANTQRLAEKNPEFSAFYGRFLEQIRLKEFERADVISDVFGPLSYAPHLDAVVRRYGQLLQPGGEAFTILRTLTTGSRDGAVLETPQFLRTWLNDAKGIEISELDMVDERGSAIRLALRRTEGVVRVPKLELTDVTAGTPPARHYEF